jgi:GntR family transcriptional regulator, transcriptional repressor for pyruvate dehydrogenase complex
LSLPWKRQYDTGRVKVASIGTTSLADGSSALEFTRAPSATEQAVAAIMRLLTSEELGPGDRLPAERDLAARVGVSRSTLREAIRGLEMMRVVEVRHGGGIFVTSLDAALLLEATGFALQLMGDREVVELLEVRAVLEGAAAGLASARMTDAQVRSLSQRLEELEAATTAEQFLAADIAFHACVAAGAGNVVLASLLDTFSSRTYRARYLNAGLSLEDSLLRGRAAHRRIHEAVAARDPEAARASASAHVTTVAAWLRSVVTEQASSLPGESALRR